MKRYFQIQLKLLKKLTPLVLVVAGILFSGLMTIYIGVASVEESSDKNTVFRIGVTGEADNKLLDLGITALKTFDPTRYTAEIFEMSEEEAKEALLNDKISAYVVFPEGFIEAALMGDVKPIKYVTTGSAAGIGSLVKDELTNVVEELITATQKGVFGLDYALTENNFSDLSYEHINKLNLKYVSYILGRTGSYEVTEVGAQGGVGIIESLFCGISVLFLFLINLPYAVIFVRKDVSINRMLAGQNVSVLKQVISEYGAYYFSVFLIVICVAVVLMTAATGMFPDGFDISGKLLYWFVTLAFVTAVLSAFSYMIFQISGDIVVGILTQFFSVIVLCYITGCFYPVSALPQSIQKAAAFLPTAAARESLSNCILNESNLTCYIIMAGYTGVFLFFALLMKRQRVLKRG